MNRKPILAIGSLNIDLVTTCDELPKRGQTVAGHRFFTSPGGKGANQAVAAAKLGARVFMAGCLGNDAFGEQLRANLHSTGVNADCVDLVEDPTGTALITVDASGANTIVVIAGANARCSPAHVDRGFGAVEERGILLVQHELRPETVEHAIRTAHSRGWFVILNPAPARSVPGELLGLVDLIVLNETEAATICGRPVSGHDDGAVAAQALVASGVRWAIVTLGERGAVASSALGTRCVGAVEAVAVDATAAGDAYIGALATALSEGTGVPDALPFAAASAALAVTRLGAQSSLPTRAEAEEFLQSRSR